MSKKNGNVFGRRDVLKASTLALGAGLLTSESVDAHTKGVNTNSSPSTLKITDLRVATVVKPGPSPCPIIRIDTNQGVYGLGEVRDGASATYALFLKSRIVGENPLQLDKNFRQIKQFGGHARQGGGVSAIEMALWDITGKVYNAPVYALLGGGGFRDKIRIYADTTESENLRATHEGTQRSHGPNVAQDGFGHYRTALLGPHQHQNVRRVGGTQTDFDAN
jgi:L-alanine-DL-glutamate epimerase-like enolase superfamily enzyme